MARSRVQAVLGAARGTCPLCQRVALEADTAGLALQWRVDLARLEWTLARVTPACLHCCTASNTDALLNAALSVSDAAGAATLQGVATHILAANGLEVDRGEMVQVALNVAHSIKVLAGNLPCRVVSDGGALSPRGVPELCIRLLETSRAGKGVKKTPSKAAVKREVGSRDGASAKKRREAVSEEEEAERGEGHCDEAASVSSKKRKASSKTPDTRTPKKETPGRKTPASTRRAAQSKRGQ